MPQQLWFKAHRYGYGWYPVTWQGWLAIAVFVSLFIPLVVTFANDDAWNGTATGVIEFLLLVAGLVILLCWVAWKKGEPAKWRWGK